MYISIANRLSRKGAVYLLGFLREEKEGRRERERGGGREGRERGGERDGGRSMRKRINITCTHNKNQQTAHVCETGGGGS